MGTWLQCPSPASAQEAKLADDKKPVAEAQDKAEYNNWITLGVGSAFINGDNAQFMRGQQMSDEVVGGIEDFHWEQDVGKRGLFQINGHGIYNNHNYSVDLGLSNPDKGFVRGGYEQFRTWYDGSGGFYPGGTNNWLSLYDEDLSIDRGRAWFEAGLTIPNVPFITFRYAHEFRDGKKDSTVWGDANVSSTPGVWPAPTATSPATRNFVPTFLDIDEKRDTFELDLKHTIGKTDFGLGARYERLDNNDSRNIHRRPGEVTEAAAAARADRYVTEREKLEEDLFNLHGFTETRFSEKLKLTLGGSFTTMDTDGGGSRIYGNMYDPVLGPYLRSQQRDSGFFDLSGGANIKQYVANLNLMLVPMTNLVVVPSLRIENEQVNGVAQYFPTTVDSAGGPLVTNAFQINTADRNRLDVTEALEARYTGIRNWSFYARGEWSETCEDRSESEAGTFENSNWERFAQKYTVGANWYPRLRLNMGGQYYYKISASDWDFEGDKISRNFQTHDLNFRMTWRPLSVLSFVTRYDFQLSTVNNQGVGLAEVEGAGMTSHIISESINWTPLARLYMQLNGSYARDGALQTAAATQAGITNVVPNLENGYWTANALIGYALDERTDLLLQYNYYRADNYVNNYLWSQPYGADAEEHSVTVGLSRRLSGRLRLNLKYGFFSYRDDTAGGNKDYTAHLIHSSLQCRF